MADEELPYLGLDSAGTQLPLPLWDGKVGQQHLHLWLLEWLCTGGLWISMDFYGFLWISMDFYGSLWFFFGENHPRAETTGNDMTLRWLEFGQGSSEMGYHGWQCEWKQTIPHWTTQILGALFSDKVLRTGTKLVRFPCNSVRKPKFSGKKNQWLPDFGSRTMNNTVSKEAARRWIVMVTTCTSVAVRCPMLLLFFCSSWHGQGSLASSPWAKKGGGKEVFRNHVAHMWPHSGTSHTYSTNHTHTHIP